jgi:hypothetical protein
MIKSFRDPNAKALFEQQEVPVCAISSALRGGSWKRWTRRASWET